MNGCARAVELRAPPVACGLTLAVARVRVFDGRRGLLCGLQLDAGVQRLQCAFAAAVPPRRTECTRLP